MTRADYYNDFEPYAAEWLRRLIAAGHIPPGRVSQRSIKAIDLEHLHGRRRVHLFAGIGGWARALELAGWPETEEVWTGSCPCQPFSVAGKRKGVDDERHLWPTFRELIRECRPATVFGEQVASADGRTWLSGVRVDLERMGYAVGAADLCAAGQGAPHIRQRLYWVAHSKDKDRGRRERRERRAETRIGAEEFRGRGSSSGGTDGRMGNAGSQGHQGHQPKILLPTGRGKEGGAAAEPGQAPGYWDRFEIIRGANGKQWRIGPGITPLAHGVPARVGKLRAYGNAIVPQVAAAFIRAYLETR